MLMQRLRSAEGLFAVTIYPLAAPAFVIQHFFPFSIQRLPSFTAMVSTPIASEPPRSSESASAKTVSPLRAGSISSFANERTAFGKPIKAYQGVSFKFADMAAKIRAIDLMVWDSLAGWGLTAKRAVSLLSANRG